MQQQTLERKMYSHSTKALWAPPTSPPKNQNNKIRMNIEISLKEKFRGSVALLQKQKKYEKLIDHLIKQHVQQHKIPVLKKGLSKKIDEKGYRIMKTEEANPQLILHKSQKLIPFRKNSIKLSSIKKESIERSKSNENKLQLPLIFKYKKKELGLQKGKNYTQKCQTQSGRDQRLKQLKQQTILKFIRQQ